MRVALMAVALAAVVPTPAEASWAERKGCPHEHRSSVAGNRIDRLLLNHRPATSETKRDVAHYATCVATRAKARYLHRKAERGWAWRSEYSNRWPITFNRQPGGWQAWAYSTGSCESGNNPATATGNGYYGAFQFLPSTWYAAGGTGLPSQHIWHYQAVIAIRWAQIAGVGQWPVCGS